MTNCLIDFFKKQDVEYTESFNFSKISAIGIGGKVRFVTMPDSIDKLVLTVDRLLQENIKYKIIGKATNLLMLEDFYDGVFILTSKLSRYFMAESTLVAECGTLLSRALYDASVLGFGGAEGLYGIPGSVGGMVFGNAGAFGMSVSDVFSSGDFYFPYENSISHLSHSDMGFSYRKSFLKDSSAILLRAEFTLTKSSLSDIRAKMLAVIERRRQTQPCGEMSLGSIFKRNGDIPVSKLIDELGLKGLSVGGAVVSEKHAGFIVNTGNATAEDVGRLIEIIKEKVYSAYNLSIEEEIEYI